MKYIEGAICTPEIINGRFDSPHDQMQGAIELSLKDTKRASSMALEALGESIRYCGDSPNLQNFENFFYAYYSDHTPIESSAEDTTEAMELFKEQYSPFYFLAQAIAEIAEKDALFAEALHDELYSGKE